MNTEKLQELRELFLRIKEYSTSPVVGSSFETVHRTPSAQLRYLADMEEAKERDLIAFGAFIDEIPEKEKPNF